MMHFAVSSKAENFIRALPKTETHLHIEGALPYSLLQQLDPERYANVPDSWRKDFRFDSFQHFESELLGYAAAWFTTPERYHEAAKLIFETLHKEQNVKYVACSMASGVIEFSGMDGHAVARAIKSAAPKGLKVDLYLGIHHNGYNDKTKSFIEESLTWEELSGYDLHGVEELPLEPWTANLWNRARDCGKYTKAHAGEFCGPDFIERVIEELGVSRIQHGVRSVESEVLLKRLSTKPFVLDVCPISNVKLRVADRYNKEEALRLLKSDVCCTISTDDPISFGNTLYDEYAFLLSEYGFSVVDLARFARNGFMTSTLNDAEKAVHIGEIDNLLETYLG